MLISLYLPNKPHILDPFIIYFAYDCLFASDLAIQ